MQETWQGSCFRSRKQAILEGRATMEGGGSSSSPSSSSLLVLEKNVAKLTVMDIYDIASLVGHKSERLFDTVTLGKLHSPTAPHY